MEDDDDFTDWLIDREECIMDLDNDELEATRKLNGVAKESNIEIIEDFINEIKDFELNKDTVEIVNALEYVLEEREADKKRIKELEESCKDCIIREELDDYVSNSITVQIDDYVSNSITVQKVIDKMEKLNKEIKNDDEVEAIFKIKQQQILQEILEDK